MIILGIDPGSVITGYGVVAWDGQRHQHIASGDIHSGQGDMAQRLHRIYCAVRDIIQQYQPTEMAIEQVFMGRNASAALKLGQARSIILLLSAMNDIPMSEYSARQTKKAVVGTGGADKNQVQYMIQKILALPSIPSEDSADALGVAICHAHTRQGLDKLTRASIGNDRAN